MCRLPRDAERLADLIPRRFVLVPRRDDLCSRQSIGRLGQRKRGGSYFEMPTRRAGGLRTRDLLHRHLQRALDFATRVCRRASSGSRWHGSSVTVRR
jgi:hypothetical protein